MNTHLLASIRTGHLVIALGLSPLTSILTPARAALPEGRSLAIERQGAGVSLCWLTITNAPYVVQARTNLVQGEWGLLDTITNAGGFTVYPIAPDDSPSRFFRVLFPQPTVAAGEPARYAHGTGGSYLYITGSFFYEGDQVRVGGLLAGGTVFVTPSLLRVELPPELPPGRHDVEILSAHTGSALALLHEAVTVVDPLADPDRLLYGPPEEPPASPSAVWLSKRGYDYYMARSDLAASTLSGGRRGITEKGLKLFDGGVAAVAPPSESGKGITERGIKLFDDSADAGITVPDSDKGISQPGIKRSIAGGVVAAIVVAARGGRDASEPEVVPFSGEVRQQVVDLAIPGRALDFVWARTYSSRIGRTGASANGWTFSYDLHLQPLGGDILIHNGTGRADRYALQPNGTYTCPEFFCEGTLSADIFRLTFADTGYWEFRSLTAATAAGKLDHIVDRNGNTVSLDYDQAGRLAAVVDDLGRTHTVAYDTAGRLESVTDSFGRRVTYRYYTGLPSDPGGGLGDLKSVTSPPVTGTPTGNDFPEGKTTTYTYSAGSSVAAENHLLLSVADALGQTVVACAYDLSQTSSSYLRCTSLQRGSDAPTMLTYQPQTPSPDNRFAAMRCVANDPVGNVNVVLYDCRNRGIEKAQIKRRAEPGTLVTDTSTLPYDKLREDDPDSTVTRWSWNNDSLCTAATAPGGQEVRFIYQGDLEPSTPARKRADCLVVSQRAPAPVDFDGDGALDSSERVWNYQFDPRFGSPGNDYRVDTFYPQDPNWGKPKKGGISAPPSGDGSDGGLGIPNDPSGTFALGDVIRGAVGYVTSATDPRGNATEAEYDEQGNCRALIVPATRSSTGVITFSRVHDAHGQLTAITNAPDANGRCRVDTFTYSQGQVTACVVDAAADGLALTASFEYDARGNLTRLVDPRGNDWLYTYNALDQCVRAQSPVNVSQRCNTGFFYDANDNLVQTVTQVRDAGDAQTGTCTDRATYDELRRLTEVVLAVDATHALTNRFVYDGNGQCVQALGGDAVSGVDPHHAMSFAYDTCGLLYREVAAPGSAAQSTTQYDYDVNGLVTRVSEGLEETPSVTTLAYDGFAGFGYWEKWEGIAAKETRKGDRVSLVGFGSFKSAPPTVRFTMKEDRGYPLDSRSANPSTANWDTSAVTSMGAAYVMGAKAKAWMVNNFARVAQITDPMGNVSTFHHDANDKLLVARQFGQTTDVPGSDGNIRLAESRYEYDDLDRCTVQRDLHFSLAAPQSPVGDGECTTAFVYAPNGACIGITNDLGGVTTASYDTAGRVYSVRVPGDKSLRTCVRDSAGNVTSVTQTDTAALGGQPQSFTRTYAYDSQDRCVSTTDGAGKTDACAYDSLSRVVRSTDAAGTQTFHHYDLLGRCTLTVGDLDGDGLEDFARDITQQSSWSPSNGRLLSTTDSHGNTTSYEYDSRGRCTAVSHADGTHELFVWSPRSNLSQETDPNGTVSVCTYDPNDRLTRCDITMQTAGGGSGGALYLKTFSYDGCDRLVAHHDDDCDGTADYDSLGNCVSETLNGLATASTYDALGNRLSLAYPGGRVLTYAYDASGCCTGIAESGASLAGFAYDGADRLARVTYANGLRSTFEYDGLDGVQNAPGDYGFGQVSHIVHASTNGTEVKTSHLSWDLKTNKGARIMPPTGTGVSTNVLALEYDRADRLVRSIVTEGTTTLRDTTYSLDCMGNRTNVIGAACAGPYTLDPASPPADYQMNQYTATPCDSRSYDDNGNLMSRSAGTVSSLSFTYDYADRLVSVSTSGFTVASYTYDALGRRASKTVNIPGEPTPVSRILRMVYDRACVIEEREDEAVVQSYVHSTGLIDTVAENDTVLQMRVGTQDYFVLADDQGNAVALSDASGAVVEGYDYDDYGAVTFLGAEGTPLVGSDGSPATSSAYGYLYCWGGLRLDAETGLHNNDGGIYFEPQTGRATRGKIRMVKDQGNGNFSDGDSTSLVASKHYITIPHDRRVPGGSSGNNPWSGGTPLGMKKGTVKFFNDAKGFGVARKAIKEAKIIGYR